MCRAPRRRAARRRRALAARAARIEDGPPVLCVVVLVAGVGALEAVEPALPERVDDHPLVGEQLDQVRDHALSRRAVGRRRDGGLGMTLFAEVDDATRILDPAAVGCLQLGDVVLARGGHQHSLDDLLGRQDVLEARPQPSEVFLVAEVRPDLAREIAVLPGEQAVAGHRSPLALCAAGPRAMQLGHFAESPVTGVLRPTARGLLSAAS